MKMKLQDKSPVKLGSSAIRILEMIHNSPEVTIPEMAKKIKISDRAIEKNIKKMKENKLLNRIDGERGGYWKLLLD